MKDYKVVTYKGPAIGQPFAVDERIDLADASANLWKEWFTPEQAKAILEAVGKLKLCLGIGKRGSDIVKRWQHKHPWLPAVTYVTEEKGGKKQMLPIKEADAAPILQKKLYDEAVKLDKLSKLTDKDNIQITSFDVKPAWWRHPTATVNQVPSTATSVSMNGCAYQFEDVTSISLKPFVDQLIALFCQVLGDAKHSFKGRLREARFRPKPECAGLCGAWYKVKVEYTEKVETKQSPRDNSVKEPNATSIEFVVPVGFLAKGSGKPLTLTMVPWNPVNTPAELLKVFTVGLDFRFLCLLSGGALTRKELRAAAFWLETKLSNKAWGAYEPPREILQAPFDAVRKSSRIASWRLATGKERAKEAKKIARSVVGGEPLAVFSPERDPTNKSETNGAVHLLNDNGQIGAWCAKHKLLDKFLPLLACDGRNCTQQLPWRMTATGLQIADSMTFVPFSLLAVHTALLEELSDVSGVSVELREPAFKNLCKKCWKKQAGEWGDLATYEMARARTVESGIYFQCQVPDFTVDDKGGASSAEGILSCTVHELMHFWSYEFKGYQGDIVTNSGFDLDEHATDIIAFKVFKNLFKDEQDIVNYVTPYGPAWKTLIYYTTANKWIAQQKPFNLTKTLEEVGEPSKLSVQLIRMCSSQNPTAIETALLEITPKVLFEFFSTWYFCGPEHPPQITGSKVVPQINSWNASNFFTGDDGLKSLAGRSMFGTTNSNNARWNLETGEILDVRVLESGQQRWASK